MYKKKNKLNKSNSSGWLDNYSEEFFINKYIDGGSIKDYRVNNQMISDNTRNQYNQNTNQFTIEELKTIEKENNKRSSDKKKIIDDRQARINKSIEAQNKPLSIQNLADQTQAIGDKFRVFPNEQSFIDDYLNPLVMVGDMASGLGRMPLDIQQGNYGNAALSLATPLATGALASIGAQNTGEFLNNAFNPIAGTGNLVKDKLGKVVKSNLEKESVKRFLEKPRFAIGRKEYLPETLKFDLQNLGGDDFAVILRGPNNAIEANLSLFKSSENWLKPGIISVDPKLQGNRIQDILYQKGLEEAQKRNFVGIRSGDYLMEPEKTLKAHSRFETIPLLPDATTKDKNIPIVGMLAHKNKNLYEDFFKKYEALPKEIRAKYSIKDIYNNFKDILPSNNKPKDVAYQNGGEINNIMKKKLKKYPAGGYLDYQDAYKGFGVGPKLYQDNSYYRTAVPGTIENINAQINQPSVFSGINDVLSSVNQGVNQITGLMSQLPQPSTGGNNIMPDVSWWGKGGASEGLMQKTDAQLNWENDQKLKQAGLFNNLYSVPSTPTVVDPSQNLDMTGIEEFNMSNLWSDYFNPIKSSNPFPSNLLGSVSRQKNGGYLKKYQSGGMMDMPIGYPEYIHKSNVFAEHVIPVPKVHFSDDTSAFDMGVNLNDLVQMNGGGIGKYANGGDMSLQGYFNYLQNQNQNRVPSNAFNSNSQRMNAEQLASATENDFMHTKLRHDRQKFADDKVDWGFMNWAKQPVGAYLGMMSTVPIVGDITKDIVGDSFLTRTEGYQVGQGVGKTTMGAGKIAGGIATGNIGMVGSGIGDVGSGVGGTIGNLNAESAMGDYNKSGYVSGKRMANASQDFGNMMNTASSLFGNVSGGLGQLKGLGGMKGMMGNMKGGQTGMQGFGNFMSKLTGFGQDGGYLYPYQEGGLVMLPEDLEIPKFKKGGLTAKKAREILHDKSVHGHPLTDKQRKYFGYISSQKKSNGGWLDSL